VEVQAAVPDPVVVVVAGRLVEVVVRGPPVAVVVGSRVDVVVVADEDPDEQAATRMAIATTPDAATTRGVPPVVERSVGVRAIR